jgi:HK97 family phage portal protein
MAFWTNLFTWGQSGRREMGQQEASLSARGTEAEVVVTETTALAHSAVFACVKLYAESIAGFDIRGYDIQLKNGKRIRSVNTTHYLSKLFAGKVNRYQTLVEFLESLIMQLVLHGNSYCLIQRVGSRIVGLLPLMADQMQVDLLANGDVQYTYRQNGEVLRYTEKEIWHVKSMGNGIVGTSPLGKAREDVGLGLSANRKASNFASRGFKPTAVLMVDQVLDDEQREAVRQNFEGLADSQNDNLHVLEAGFKYQQVSLSPADAQLLETRKFQTEEICRFFGVPPALVGSSAVSVFGAGFEQVMEGFFRLSLRPIIERIECSINTHLLAPGERGSLEFQFDTEDLLRLMPAAAAARTKDRLQGGVITPNEARIEAGYLPVDDPHADALYMQQQMVKLGSGGANSTPVPIQGI